MGMQETWRKTRKESTVEAKLIKMQRVGGNRKPVGLAASAFYDSCKKGRAKISKEAIGEAFHVSNRTVYTNEARIKKSHNFCSVMGSA